MAEHRLSVTTAYRVEEIARQIVEMFRLALLCTLDRRCYGTLADDWREFEISQARRIVLDD